MKFTKILNTTVLATLIVSISCAPTRASNQDPESINNEGNQYFLLGQNNGLTEQPNDFAYNINQGYQFNFQQQQDQQFEVQGINIEGLQQQIAELRQQLEQKVTDTQEMQQLATQLSQFMDNYPQLEFQYNPEKPVFEQVMTCLNQFGEKYQQSQQLQVQLQDAQQQFAKSKEDLQYALVQVEVAKQKEQNAVEAQADTANKYNQQTDQMNQFQAKLIELQKSNCQFEFQLNPKDSVYDQAINCLTQAETQAKESEAYQSNMIQKEQAKVQDRDQENQSLRQQMQKVTSQLETTVQKVVQLTKDNQLQKSQMAQQIQQLKAENQQSPTQAKEAEVLKAQLKQITEQNQQMQQIFGQDQDQKVIMQKVKLTNSLKDNFNKVANPQTMRQISESKHTDGVNTNLNDVASARELMLQVAGRMLMHEVKLDPQVSQLIDQLGQITPLNQENMQSINAVGSLYSMIYALFNLMK